MIERRPPVVTDIDRQWAAAQEPAGWAAKVEAMWLRKPEHSRPEEPLTWAQHVAEQAERFEAKYGHERKTPAEWSGLWRRVWWPKADPSVLHGRAVPAEPHPYAKRGDPCWLEALALLNKQERKVAMRFGVLAFRRDDPRAKVITGGANA